MSRRSITGSLALGIVLLAGACTSQPSAKAVTLDVIESLDSVPQSAKDCMTEIVDAMDNDELEQIADTDEDFLSMSPEGASEEMQAFIDELADCREAG
jgi:hypothetical protein